MLSLSQDQMSEFEQGAWRAFEAKLAAHLETYFSWKKSLWPDGKADALARFGCERARYYGFETERSVMMFVTLMPTLGSRFDEDPMLPWAAEKLHDPTIREPVHRIDQLNDLAMLYLRKTNGRDGRKAYKGLRQSHAYLVDGNAPADPVQSLMAAFPARAAASPATQEVITQAIGHARGFGIDDPLGLYICAALAFFFGPYFYADPQMPAVRATLYDTGLTPPRKTAALRETALAALNALYQQAEGGADHV